MLGGLRGQARVGSVMRVWVAYRGLGAGRTSSGDAVGAVLRRGFMLSHLLKKQHTANLVKSEDTLSLSCNMLLMNNFLHSLLIFRW